MSIEQLFLSNTKILYFALYMWFNHQVIISRRKKKLKFLLILTFKVWSLYIDGISYLISINLSNLNQLIWMIWNNHYSIYRNYNLFELSKLSILKICDWKKILFLLLLFFIYQFFYNDFPNQCNKYLQFL